MLRATRILLLTLCSTMPCAGAGQLIAEYPIPTPLAIPVGITAGPDGNMWFTEMGCTKIGDACLSKIGKITPSGVITEYTIPTPLSYPAGITASPDGNLWFCEEVGNKIGRITPGGVITEYPLPSTGQPQPYGITAGPDGNVWFTEFLSGKVGKITPAGVITEYATNSYGLAYSITAGPDGRLWFGSSIGGGLFAITTAGVSTEIPSQVSGSLVQGITAGPDGKIWYTTRTQEIVRYDPVSSQILGRYLPDRRGPMGMITRGLNNDLWFTVQQTGGLPQIGRITTAGVVTEFPLANEGAVPVGIAVGTDGSAWFTEHSGNAIGVALVGGAPSSAVTVSQSALTFSGAAGGAAAPSQTLSVTHSAATPFTATVTIPFRTNWLKISPSGDLTSDQVITVTADPSGITNTGTYTGNIAITSGNLTQMVDVTFTASAPTTGNVKADANSLAFVYRIGGAVPDAQPNYITSALAPDYPRIYHIPFTASASVSSPTGGKWLSIASGSEGTTPATVSVAVNPAGLAAGTYSGTVTVNPAGGSPVVVPVSLTVTASTAAPFIAGVVNAASFASGAVAPGEIVTLGGTAVGPSAGLGLRLDSSGKVATGLGGVTVLFSGHPAPLTYVSDTQINCVVPYEIAGESKPRVEVQYGGLTSNSFALQLAAAAPGVFTQDGSGTGLVSGPATQGGVVVLYLTGEGLTSPAGMTGGVTTVDSRPGYPLTPQPIAPLTVTVGGQPATVAFFGEAPGFVAGVLQLNLQIPTGLSPGKLPVVVSIGGAASQSGITIPVQ